MLKLIWQFDISFEWISLVVLLQFIILLLNPNMSDSHISATCCIIDTWNILGLHLQHLWSFQICRSGMLRNLFELHRDNFFKSIRIIMSLFIIINCDLNNYWNVFFFLFTITLIDLLGTDLSKYQSGEIRQTDNGWDCTPHWCTNIRECWCNENSSAIQTDVTANRVFRKTSNVLSLMWLYRKKIVYYYYYMNGFSIIFWITNNNSNSNIISKNVVCDKQGITKSQIS